jgi:Zn-dependent peptidase ImmA (M78 family)
MKRIPKLDVEQFVRSLLKRHGIKSPPIPVEQLVRQLDVEFRKTEYPDLSFRGFIVRQDFPHKKGLIYINSSQTPNVQRFALAHEIGHFLLHGESIYVDRVERTSAGAAEMPTRDPEEILADLFAAELLMPQRMLLADLKKKKVDPDNDDALLRLATKYKVSLAAMLFRLQELGLLRSRF